MSNKAQKTKQAMANTIKLTALCSAVSLAMTSVAYANDDYKTIGDLEIYKRAEAGQVTVTMMLDISGSMMSVDGACSNPVRANSTSARGTTTYHLKDAKGNIINEITRANGQKENTSKGVKLISYGFRLGDGNWYYCDGPTTRMEKLKKAMLDIVSQEGVLANTTKLGVGTFPTQHNWFTGQISIPAKELTLEHRWDIMKYLSTLMPVGSTPSAQAYVEAGAYMLGTTTSSLGQTEKRVITVGSMDIQNSNQFRLLYCGSAAEHYKPAGNGQYFDTPNPPTNLSYNSETLKWYTCNDGTNRTFPAFDYDMASKTSSWLTTIIPNRMDALDFNLFPKFDFVFGEGRSTTNQFPVTAMTNETVPRNPDFWRNRFTQFAQVYHFGRLLEYKVPTIKNSGFGLSDKSTKKPDGLTYEAGVKKGGECDGYGIYFLTDGQPNGANTDALSSANLSLGKTGRYNPTVSKAEFPDGAGGAQGYWNMIGSYAKDLSTGNNPLKTKIKTATVGFGAVFTPAGGLPTIKKVVDGTEIDVVNCDAITTRYTDGTTNDARNLCKLGELGYGYGDGGFLATSEASAVSKSVVEFAKRLNQTIPSMPAGSISIPKDPLSVNSIQPYAYLPMLQPEVGKNLATWEGNLKKYDTLFGTLYGKDGIRLYTTSETATEKNGNFPFALNPKARDLWQSSNEKDNTGVLVGGARSRLKHPSTSNLSSVRSVYVESNGKLQKVSSNGTTLTDFDKLVGYDLIDKAYILNFLGFKVSVNEDSYNVAPYNTLRTDEAKLTEALKGKSLQARPMLGGVVHSVPVLASYEGQLDGETGNITTEQALRSDKLLYGSMDGAVHLIDAKDGTEDFAFIPRAMFIDKEQRKALLLENAGAAEGQPKFGVDAPWATHATYDYQIGTPTKMVATKMSAYGGLRMGGVGFYALDISNPANPSLTLAVDGTNKAAKGFNRLGQVWARPLAATVKTGAKTTDQQQVIFVSGGYDMCYENPRFTLGDSSNADKNCQNKSQADGNAIYMVDAKTGDVLQEWTFQGGSTTDDRQHMVHSIVSEVVGLDRNNNGHVDSLYFADLGGQIFRIDLQEGVAANSDNFTRRIVRVFAANEGMPSNHLNYRFYEKPEISFYNTGNGRIAMVNIASGDRSSPLHKHRALDNPNRIYGIIDRDLATSVITSANGTSKLVSRNLTHNALQHHNTVDIESGSDDYRKKLMDNLKDGIKQGWYYDMNRFDGRIDVKDLKSVGAGVVMGSVYYTSVYSPDYQYTKGDSCSASISGGTERQMYCLPWGICADNTGKLSTSSKNGTLGFMKAGQGIQELAVATVTNQAGKSTSFKTLVGMETIGERRKDSGERYAGGDGSAWAEGAISGGTGTGSDGPSGDFVVRTDQVLKVNRWYDLQTAEDQ